MNSKLSACYAALTASFRLSSASFLSLANCWLLSDWCSLSL